MRFLRSWGMAVMMSALILVILSGCGPKGGNPSSVSGGGETVSGTTLLPKLNITDKKVEFLTWDDKSELTNPDTGFYEVNELMKRYYGCELEFKYVTYADLATKLATSKLSGQSPDIVKFKAQDFPNNITKDLVQSFDEFIDLNSDLWKDVREVNDSYMVDGKHYNLITKRNNNGVVFYHTDLFEDNGVDTPLELYRQGKWTWSKLEEIAKQLTMDTDRDGIVDIYGWEGHPLYFYPTANLDFVTLADSGTYANNMRSPVLAKAMDFISKTGMSGSNCRALSLDGATRFSKKQTAIFWDENWRISTYADQIKSGEIGIAPTPKMDDADRYYVAGGFESSWIAKGASNPEGAVAYSNILRFMEVDTDTAARLRKKTQDRYGFTEEQMQLLDELQGDAFTQVIPKMLGVGEWGNTYMWEMWNELAVYETPWNTVLEKYYPILDNEIEAANS